MALKGAFFSPHPASASIAAAIRAVTKNLEALADALHLNAARVRDVIGAMVTRRHLAVIGAGLAGGACARALARSGFDVTVLESGGQPAQGASGNPIGILHVMKSRDYNLASQWVDLGTAKTLQWLEELQPLATDAGIGLLGHSCGVLQMDDEALDLICWDAMGAWVKPGRLVAACLADAKNHGAAVHFNTHVTSIDDAGRVTLAGSQTQLFDAVVVCSAHDMDRLLPRQTLMLNAIGGTVSSFSLDEEHSLPCVICADGYATPVVEGEMVVGASYERDGDLTMEQTAQSNLAKLETISPKLAKLCATLPVTLRKSVRSATLDRMPHIGRVLDPDAPLTPSMSRLPQMPRASRTWVLGGLGSRGLTFAPLGAEVIAAQMRGQDPAVPERLLDAADPVRFALRRHQRRK
jgi:tRNA 5-methylaminomethyl-2-thiouridine biosynthesis bifunctional protein